MPNLLPTNWGGVLGILALWFAVVFLALRVIDRLFPRIRRDDEQSAAASFDPASLYPAPPRLLRTFGQQTPPALRLAVVDPAYWRSNVKTIAAILAIWFSVCLIVIFLSPWLNQFQVLSGFPLGYYIGAQGSLIIFLGLIVFYGWRAARNDAQFRTSTQITASESENQNAMLRTGFFLIIITLVSLLLVLLLGTLEGQAGLTSATYGWLLLAVTIILYAVIGIRNHAGSLEEYFVAGRRVPAFFNGLAIAGDWMSAATFLSMAGTLWLIGFDGLAYIMGWTGGFVIVAVLLAPYLRRFGQFTIPDFVAARYGGNVARVVAAIIAMVISFAYVTAQVTGIGIIMSRFLGVNYIFGVLIALGAVLFCSYLGGMRAITWTQVSQCLIIVGAYLIPVTLLSLRSTGLPFPQITYGQALQQIAHLEQQLGLDSYTTPFNNWTPWNFAALLFCLMLGTAGMPHILVRFYTVPDAGAARRSVGWAMLFICLVYLTAPAYAAYSRWEVLQNVIGKPIASLPDWTINWAQAGLLSISDKFGDGILHFSGLRIDPDVVVLATPDFAGLPHMVGALVAAGGLAAALSTADGLLMIIATALSHDIYARTINPTTSSARRLFLGRMMVLVAALAAAFVATRRLGIIVQLVAMVFSLAAATFFPILVLGIFWKRATGRAAVAGMISGLLITLAYMMANILEPHFNILGITNVAAGIFGIVTNFSVVIAVSYFSPPPPPQAQTLVDSLRQP